MHKLYFAKSNTINSKTVDRVRKYLQSLNIELKEFKGGRGNYTHNELLACDSMIVLPGECNDYQTIIGKGIYSQIEAFEKMLSIKNLRDADNRILVVTSIEDLESQGIHVSNFRSMEIDDSTDWTEYATLYVDCMTDREIKRVFESDPIPCNTSNPCSEIELPNGFSEWYSKGLIENEPKHTIGCFKLVYSMSKPLWWSWVEGDMNARKGYKFTYLGDSRIDGMPTFKVEGSSRDTVEEAFRSIGGISNEFVLEPIISLNEILPVMPMSPPSLPLMYMEVQYGSDINSHPMKYLLIG